MKNDDKTHHWILGHPILKKKHVIFHAFFVARSWVTKIHMRQGDLQETGKYKPSLFFKWDDISKA